MKNVNTTGALEFQSIVLFTTELRMGGAERVVFELAVGLRARGVSVKVVALDGRGVFAEKLMAAGIEVVDLQARRKIQFFGAIRQLRRLLKQQNISILHTHLIHATLVGRLAARGLGLRVLSTSHIVDRRVIWWHGFFDRLTARWNGVEICVSRAVLEHQRNCIGERQDYFKVIYNGLDFEALNAQLVDQCAAREVLGLEEKGEIIIGCLGRYDRQKGFDVLIQAMALLVHGEGKQQVKLIIGGYGKQEAALKGLVQDLLLENHVEFVGFQQSPYGFIQALDVMVMPSRWEGFGLVALETMACGIPLIASDVDSLSELLKATNGDMLGALVPSEDQKALAKALTAFVGNSADAKAMALKAKQHVEKFTTEAMLDQHMALYF